MLERMFKKSIKRNAGLKITPFELHHVRKTRTEITNVMKTGKSFLSNWSKLFISAIKRPKIPIYVTKNRDGEVSNHIVMARKKTEEKALAETSPKKRSSVSNHSNYPFQFFEKYHNKKSLGVRFRKSSQTAEKDTDTP